MEFKNVLCAFIEPKVRSIEQMHKKFRWKNVHYALYNYINFCGCSGIYRNDLDLFLEPNSCLYIHKKEIPQPILTQQLTGPFRTFFF